MRTLKSLVFALLFWHAALLSLGMVTPVLAQQRVDLELILAIDSSASVDFEEFELQAQGMANAFRDPTVLAVIRANQYKAIAVSVVEWASADYQSVNVPWMMLHDAQSLERMAQAIENMPRNIMTGATSISGLLEFSAGLFPTNGYEGTQRTIDVSTDGRNNQGKEVSFMRDLVTDEGITINGLTILNDMPRLNRYFEHRIMGGFGAFVEVARDYEDYGRAFLRKLIREIRSLPIGRAPDGQDRRAVRVAARWPE